MTLHDSTLTLGSQLIRTLIDLKSQPPLVRRKYQSLGVLHAELRFFGLRLVEKRPEGPEAGYMLFYVKGNVLVRIKTRGTRTKYRGGVPHLTVSVQSGKTGPDGKLDTSYAEEMGKFDVSGNVVSKNVPNAPQYNASLSPLGRANAEKWSDETHFNFPDLVLDDQCVERLWPDG